MRILITADLHYDIPRSREPAQKAAREAVGIGGDALVLVGDTAGADVGPFRECLHLFDGFGGRKLLVPGNHCLWCREGETSLDRYEKVIPDLTAEAGFTVLDHEPVLLEAASSPLPAPGAMPFPVRGEGHASAADDGACASAKTRKGMGPKAGPRATPGAAHSVGLAGSIGWYDYSFADESLGLHEDFYRAKIAPGAAEYMGGYEELLERHRDSLTDRHRGMGVRWMDGQHVKLGMSDEEFLGRLCERLRRQLEDLSRRASQIVVFLHHLPLAGLVPADRPDRFAFAAAYMGATRLGEVILEFPKVTHVYCGHSHWPARAKMEHIDVVNVGSTYVEKRLEVLELPEFGVSSSEF